MGLSIVAVLSLFIIIVMVSNAVLVWLGVSTAQASTRAVVDTLRTDVDNRVLEFLNQGLMIPTAAVLRITRLVAMGWLDINDDNSMMRELYTDIFTWQYSGQYVGSAEGNAHLSSIHNSTTITVSFTNKTLNLRCDYYSPIGVDPAPVHTSGYYRACWKYVPAQRTWYIQQAANVSQSPRYSSIYYFVGAQGAVPGITMTSSIFAPNGTFIGVSAVDMYLTFLDDVSQSIAGNIGEHTVAYIVEASTGLLVATSKGLSGGTNIRYSATNTSAEPPEVTVSASALDFAALAGSSTPTHFTVNVNSVESWVDVIPINVLNLEWYFVVVLNSNDFLSLAEAMQTQLIIIACVISVCAFLLTVLVMIGVTVPLRVLQGEMASVAGMDLESVDLGRSPSQLSEVASMQSSFVRMVYNMMEYRNYMPASILTRVDDDEEEELLPEKSQPHHTESAAASPKNAKRQSIHSSIQDGRSHKSSTDRGSNRSSIDVHKVHATISSMEVKKKRITIALVNVRGFHTYVQNNADTFSTVHGVYMSKLLEAVNTHRGTSDVFQGDRFVATWNTARQLGTHRANGCHAVTSASEEIFKATSLEVSGAVTSGECRCGNMGCVGMKKYTFLGPAVSFVFIAERLTRKYDAKVLVDGSVEDEVRNLYVMRKVDHVMVPRLSDRPFQLFELQARKQVSEDEWMYQLQEGEAKGASAKYQTAMDQFFKGNVAAALEALEGTSLDPPSMRLRERIQQWKGQGGTGKPPVEEILFV